MLYQFMEANRNELIARARAKVAARSAPKATPEELKHGVPLFLSQYIAGMRLASTDRAESSATVETSASKHGGEMLKHGFTIAQVVHDYGDVCQAVTQLALERNVPISNEEFKVLNLYLDNAIAAAVSEYARQREVNIADAEVERLGFLAHELRNRLNSAILAFQAISTGNVGVAGSTGAVLGRSLQALRELIDRSLTEVRISAGLHQRTRILISEFFEEVEVVATLEARAKGLMLSVQPGPHGVAVEADRQLLGAAVSNLLQNAFKFTRAGGHVALRNSVANGRGLIEVEDECGGLPPGKAEDLFRVFDRRGADRSGLGLGLAISRQGIAVSGGNIAVRDKPGEGCVFTIDLPLAAL